MPEDARRGRFYISMEANEIPKEIGHVDIVASDAGELSFFTESITLAQLRTALSEAKVNALYPIL